MVLPSRSLCFYYLIFFLNDDVLSSDCFDVLCGRVRFACSLPGSRALSCREVSPVRHGSRLYAQDDEEAQVNLILR
jgi:hypothetical protein